ncbi:MAG: pantoate--beta-alanine ligase [Burkholderiales bacterium]
MDVISSISALRKRLQNEPSVGLVPTMGNVHGGHLALVDLAKRHSEFVIATIFVNRLQFGAGEDFSRYPRTFEEDCSKFYSRGVSAVFAPDESEMYPRDQYVHVEPPPVANELCGEFRPGHFKGVATVVTKLFNIARPNIAVFGKKDYQQLFIIRALVEQLNLPIEIIAGETVRESDGLALSSRNSYLNAKERQGAPRLYRTLVQVKDEIASGERDFAALTAKAETELAKHGWKVDYVSLCNRETLERATANDSALVILGAAWLGGTRLIDNVEI